MPGPGPHLIYSLGSGLGLMITSHNRFSPHHCICYSLNSFFGPDIGSFTEWVISIIGLEDFLGSTLTDLIHHPLYYVVLLGFVLSIFYSWASRFVLHKGLLNSLNGVPLSWKQCFLLISAGSLSHFFLDHLFEENGKTSTYAWILSTGWWDGRAPINPDAVIVTSFLCTALIVGFMFIHRVRASKSTKSQYYESMKLIIVITTLYCIWCASQIYMVQPRRPAVGEEADLGVLVFLFTYFFLPLSLCIASMFPKDYLDARGPLPM